MARNEPYFHVWKDVAQLKRENIHLRRYYQLHFHVWKDVAQLKPNTSNESFSSWWQWISMSEKMWPNWNFRIIRIYEPSRYTFPCLKRCGPIETWALRWSFSLSFLSSYFHVWKDVAQLKLIVSQRVPARVSLHFHVWKDVAQLKPSTAD